MTVDELAPWTQPHLHSPLEEAARVQQCSTVAQLSETRNRAGDPLEAPLDPLDPPPKMDRRTVTFDKMSLRRNVQNPLAISLITESASVLAIYKPGIFIKKHQYSDTLATVNKPSTYMFLIFVYFQITISLKSILLTY